MTRRTAFTVAGQAAGGLAAIGIILPALGFAVAPILKHPEETWETVGSPDDFNDETYKAKIITLVPGIGEAGKSTVYVRRGNPDFTASDSSLPQETPGEYIAISTRCAHLGCPVRFVQAAGNFICPCHGGVYNILGRVIGGPPVRPLDRFQTRVVNKEVQIGPRYSVTSQLEPVRARDPGEFVGGVWEYIYPPRPDVSPPPN